jgi:glycogen debranching enzyme
MQMKVRKMHRGRMDRMTRSFIVAVLLLGAGACAQPSPSPVAASRPASALPVWSTTEAHPDRYVSVHGLRAFAGGYSEDGLEFWTFPLQLVSHYGLEFVRPGEAPLPGITVLSAVEVDPLGVTRIYSGPDFRVREHITTRGMHPGVLVRFEVEGPRDLELKVRFRSSLNLMWPAAIGGQEMAWDEDARGFLLKEPTNRFRALISSPQAGKHSEPNNDRRGSAFDRFIFLTLEPTPCTAGRCATLVLAGQSEKDEDVHATTAALLSAPDSPPAEDVQRFDGSRVVRITTPDAEANRAIRWAQIALEQAWTCNARLGCGLVAGYGPSHGVRRPQYAWYFAGDGLIATQALLAEGDYERAAQELEFIYRYQDPDNGMIWHEITQSAPFLDWANDYPYFYVHVDITFDFLAVLAGYYRATGDRAFLARHWPATLEAYRYCLSTLDEGDGLPRIPAGKMGGNEQDPLTDELTLAATWVEAAHAMSELATAMGDAALGREAEAASARARAGIRARYRDAGAQRWISGFLRSGTPGESTAAADLAAITSGAATPEEASATLDRLMTPGYLAPWGLRSTPTTARDYDPGSYAKGSVWGHRTAAAAEIFWRAQRPDDAYRLWRALVRWASADSPGHMHEVMNGDTFTPQRESVPEQTWSSAGFLSATIRGMLGLQPDATSNLLEFAPQLPASWRTLRVERVRVGQSVVDLHWKATSDGVTLDVQNSGPPFRLRWTERGQDGAEPAVLEREIAPGRTRLNLPHARAAA